MNAVRITVCTLVVLLLLPTNLLRAQDARKWANILKTGERDARRDAAFELMQMGEHAAPALPELIRALEDRDSQVWSNAISAIANIGPPAQDAVVPLIKQLDSYEDQRRYRAAYALGRIGKAAVPALEEALGDRQSRARAAAAKALAFVGEEAIEVADSVAKRLADDDPTVRREAAMALAAMGPTTVELIRPHLRSTSKTSQLGAVEACQALGQPAAGLAEPLQRLCHSSDADVRSRAYRAVAATVGVNQENGDLFLEGLDSDNAEVLQAALDVLADALPNSPFLVKGVVQRLPSDSIETRRSAVYLLGRVQGEASEVVDVLVSTLGKAAQSDAAIVDSLARIGQPAVAPLLGALADTETSGDAATPRSSAIAAALGRIGEIARKPLIEALQNDNPRVRAGAARALGTLRMDPSAVAALQFASGDEEALVRAAAVGALLASGKISPAASETVWLSLTDPDARVRAAAAPVLRHAQMLTVPLSAFTERMLGDESVTVRLAAVRALGQVQLTSREVLIDLLKLAVNDEESEVRAAALLAASRIGRRDVHLMLPVLAKALNDKDPAIRRAAAESCRRLAQHVDMLQPELVKLVRDDVASVSSAAVLALAEMREPSPGAFDAILPLVKSPDPLRRAAAIRGLAGVSTDSRKLMPHLVAALDDPDVSVRRRAGYAAARLGKDGHLAVAKLFGLLRSESDAEMATQALRRINSAGPEAIPVLIDGLDDEGRRFFAIYLLGRAGTHAKPALPRLQQMLDMTDNSRLRRFLRTAIERIDKA